MLSLSPYQAWSMWAIASLFYAYQYILSHILLYFISLNVDNIKIIAIEKKLTKGFHSSL